MRRVGQLISNPGGMGGAEKIAVYLSVELQAQGFVSEVYVLDTNTWLHERGRINGFEVITLPRYVQKFWSIKQLPLLAVTLGHFLKSRKLDVLHSHMYSGILRGALASKYAGVPHVGTHHDNHSIDEKTKSRVRWLNLAGAIGTNFAMISHQMMQYYINRGVKEQYCCFIYNGVDGKRFKFNEKARDQLRKRLNVVDDEMVFIAPARLQPIKGFDVLINAFMLIRNLPFRLLILGDGSERNKLEEMVRKANLQDKIHFIGSVNNVEDYLSAADVFTLASRNEGLPCSIIEAMFAQLPIVTTNVGGNAELVRQGQNGYLVQPEDHTNLALTLKNMIQYDKSKLKEMSNLSSVHAQNFTFEKMTERYISLYRGVCLD